MREAASDRAVTRVVAVAIAVLATFQRRAKITAQSLDGQGDAPMGDVPEVERVEVTIKLDPFYDPDAADYYANMVAVGSTAFEVILAFSQVFPDQVKRGDSEVAIRPQLRVTLPPAAARRLLSDLSRQLKLRESIEAPAGGGE